MVGLSQNPDLIAARGLRRAGIPTIIAVALLCAYLAARAFAVAHEFPMPGADIGIRDFWKDGIDCRKYFRLKDWIPVRTFCPT
ncbi:MAG TPA: hypothetical protein VIY90_16320 [Steroidobacteraceae bacterium]